jgi:hypothetical protein
MLDLSLFAIFLIHYLTRLSSRLFILSINYKAKETLKVAQNDVLKLIESTFLLH